MNPACDPWTDRHASAAGDARMGWEWLLSILYAQANKATSVEIERLSVCEEFARFEMHFEVERNGELGLATALDAMAEAIRKAVLK